jgi:hypothetical protein
MSKASVLRNAGLGVLGCLALWAVARAERTARPEPVGSVKPANVVSLEAYRAARGASPADEPAQDATSEALKEARAAVDLRLREAVRRLDKAS